MNNITFIVNGSLRKRKHILQCKYGRLTPLEICVKCKRDKRRSYVKCQCDCGISYSALSNRINQYKWCHQRAISEIGDARYAKRSNGTASGN